MIAIRDRDELVKDFQAYQDGRLPDLSVALDTDEGALIEARADAIEGFEYALRQAEKNVFPQTADEESLLLHAEVRLGPSPRKPATKAEGGELTASGTTGSVVPAGSALSHEDGTRYQTTSAGTIDGTGEVVVGLESISLGSACNKAVGAALTFESPPAGVQAEAEVSFDLSHGYDQETLAELLNRLLDAIRRPPAGGRNSDYREWARAVAGVADGFVYGPSSVAPLGRRGMGLVDVAITAVGSKMDRLVTDDVLQATRDYIDARRPTHMLGLLVVRPTALPVTFELAVTPKHGYEWDWTSTTVYTCIAWDSAARRLSWGAALPAGVAQDVRICVAGELAEVASVGTDYTILKAPLETADPTGEVIYPGGPLTAPIQAAILGWCNSLGPARGTAADPDHQWEDAVRVFRVLQALSAVQGIDLLTVVAPATDVIPTNDPSLPGAPIELCICGGVTVRPL